MILDIKKFNHMKHIKFYQFVYLAKLVQYNGLQTFPKSLFK